MPLLNTEELLPDGGPMSGMSWELSCVVLRSLSVADSRWTIESSADFDRDNRWGGGISKGRVDGETTACLESSCVDEGVWVVLDEDLAERGVPNDALIALKRPFLVGVALREVWLSGLARSLPFLAFPPFCLCRGIAGVKEEVGVLGCSRTPPGCADFVGVDICKFKGLGLGVTGFRWIVVSFFDNGNFRASLDPCSSLAVSTLDLKAGCWVWSISGISESDPISRLGLGVESSNSSCSGFFLNGRHDPSIAVILALDESLSDWSESGSGSMVLFTWDAL